MAACEVIWLKRILKDLGVPIKDLIPLYCDNMSSIYMAQNPVFHTHTKHIELMYHLIRERVQAGDINLQHINMNLQTVDIFTKALGADKLRQFMLNLGFTILDFPSLRGVQKRTNRLNRVPIEADTGYRPNRVSTEAVINRKEPTRVELEGAC